MNENATHRPPNPSAGAHNLHRLAGFEAPRLCLCAHPVAGQPVQMEEALAHSDGGHVAGHAQVGGGAEAAGVQDAVAIDHQNLDDTRSEFLDCD